MMRILPCAASHHHHHHRPRLRLMRATMAAAVVLACYSVTIVLLLQMRRDDHHGADTLMIESSFGDPARTGPQTRQRQLDHVTNRNFSAATGLSTPELPIAPPSSLSSFSDDSMAACLLVMDDNHLLPEWLAYHYHATSLRHLILAVDPRSRTSPAAIVARWQRYMNITTWHRDDAFMNAAEQARAQRHVQQYFNQRGETLSEPLVQHRARQRMFYYKCLQQHYHDRHRFVLLIDSDEYVRINHDTARRKQVANMSTPALHTPGSVLTLLRRELYAMPANISVTPCIQIPRWRFGNKEIVADKKNNGGATAVSSSLPTYPLPLNITNQLATLRWRYHAAPDDYPLNKISKTIVDLSRLSRADLQPVDSIHLPLRQYCAQRKLHIRAHQSVLLLHHYLNSYEQYMFRDDARLGKERSWRIYRKTASKAQEGPCHAMDPWLAGFVDAVGVEAATLLLQGAGQLQ